MSWKSRKWPRSRSLPIPGFEKTEARKTRTQANSETLSPALETGHVRAARRSVSELVAAEHDRDDRPIPCSLGKRRSNHRIFPKSKRTACCANSSRDMEMGRRYAAIIEEVAAPGRESGANDPLQWRQLARRRRTSSASIDPIPVHPQPRQPSWSSPATPSEPPGNASTAGQTIQPSHQVAPINRIEHLLAEARKKHPQLVLIPEDS